MNEPPLKRRRENDSETPGSSGSASFEKDKDVWLYDGNVVLVCEVGDHRIGFRFYQGLLTQRCEVFRDMFSVCDASQTGDEVYQGCPVIVMHDAPADIRRLLMYIVDRDFAKDLTTLTLHELASLLRMSTKYVFPSLRQSVITHLKVLYPSTLDDFLAETRLTLLPVDFNGITGVNLGLECDVPSILPVAYYLCSVMKFKEILNGITFADTGMPVKLSQTTHEALATFQGQWSITIASKALVGFPKHICEFRHCRSAYPRYLSSQDILMQNSSLSNGFFSYEAEYDKLGGICADCTRKLHRRRVTIQRAAWSKLPYCCKLGTWEELLKEC